MAGFVHARPALAIAGDRTVNESRIDRAHVYVAKTKPRHHARPKLFDQNVSALDERNEFGTVSLIFEVERYAGLAPIEHEKGCALPVDHRRKAPCILAAGLFDLDHLGAGFGE